MQKHILVTLAVGCLLEKAGAPPFDLDATSRLKLDVLDVGAAMTDDLGTEVESRNRVKIDGDLRLWPFALAGVSLLHTRSRKGGRDKYPSKLISLKVLRLPTTETALIH